ncbi:MAG: protein BatD, partial [Candidatus Omnitrophica bacterium]|nr:protein BatD [Candidatus Omnitrophota bacterium]
MIQTKDHRLQVIGSRTITFFLSVVFFMLSFSCFSEDISFDVSVDRKTASLGSGIELRLNFRGTQSIRQPQLPEIEGFSQSYIGPSSNINIVNGRVSSSISHIYRLLPLKVGDLMIPSLTVEYNGQTFTSEPIAIKITPGSGTQLNNQDFPEEENQATLEERVYLRLDAEKKIAYVNEKIPITIRLYVNDLNVRYNAYPELIHEGFLIDNLSEPRQYSESIGGLNFQVLEFKANAFALRPGELTLGPASFDCVLLVRKETRKRFPSVFDDFDNFFGSDSFDDFFSSYERYPLRLKAGGIAIAVKELPDKDKPAGFNAALGDYSFDLEVQPKQVNEGDPITLKLIISGSGNLKTVNMPHIDFGDDFKVYEPQVTQTANSKIFELIVIPKKAAITQIPQIAFSFFNPDRDQYQTITKGPVAIKVIEVKEKQAKVVEGSYPQAGFTEETAGEGIIYIKESTGGLRERGNFLYKNEFFLFLQIIPLIGLIILISYYKESQRLKTDIRYARRLRAPQQAKKAIQSAQRLI